MHNDKVFSLAEFQAANNGRSISGIDYLQAIYASTPLHFDFLLSYANLLYPRLQNLDGRAYIADLFEADRHKELIETTQDADQAQYWMNLLEITGLFEDLTTEQATTLARTISECWNMKISSEFGDSYGKAKYIIDNDTGEIFVTIAKQAD